MKLLVLVSLTSLFLLTFSLPSCQKYQLAWHESYDATNDYHTIGFKAYGTALTDLDAVTDPTGGGTWTVMIKRNYDVKEYIKRTSVVNSSEDQHRYTGFIPEADGSLNYSRNYVLYDFTLGAGNCRVTAKIKFFETYSDANTFYQALTTGVFRRIYKASDKTLIDQELRQDSSWAATEALSIVITDTNWCD
mmetsp:Transcript_33654/g.34945  ORF Transcript_33654/g.34945 Transcript_33654/m.34945 type:complete len:191 (-) Transcript_33654:142-714(-)